MKKKLLLGLVVVLSVLSFFRLAYWLEIADKVEKTLPQPSFLSSITGTNFEVHIPNHEDPAEFCIQAVPGSHRILISGLNYFHIQQGSMVFRAVAIDNQIFEINEELTGCWQIVRYEDDFLGRLVNWENTAQITFKTVNHEEKSSLYNWLERAKGVFRFSENISALSLLVNISVFSASLVCLCISIFEEDEREKETEPEEEIEEEEEKEKEDSELD